MSKLNLSGTLKTALIGKSRDLSDRSIFHKLSLIAFFAWVGLGADGLSSSCYGPEETFKALNGHIYLSLIVAAASVVTLFLISASYSQIIELFPTGGGGYLVASKLLSPNGGLVSGSALLIDGDFPLADRGRFAAGVPFVSRHPRRRQDPECCSL